jgi:hypothetical protein
MTYPRSRSRRSIVDSKCRPKKRINVASLVRVDSSRPPRVQVRMHGYAPNTEPDVEDGIMILKQIVQRIIVYYGI